MVDVVPTQPATISPPSFTGFDHPQIRQVAQAKISVNIDDHERMVKQYLTLVAIINNKLIRARMHDHNNVVSSENVLDSNETLRMAARCLAYHFSGPFSRHLGLKQVDAWSRLEVVPQESLPLLRMPSITKLSPRNSHARHSPIMKTNISARLSRCFQIHEFLSMTSSKSSKTSPHAT
jgi:hypothetical protein